MVLWGGGKNTGSDCCCFGGRFVYPFQWSHVPLSSHVFLWNLLFLLFLGIVTRPVSWVSVIELISSTKIPRDSWECSYEMASRKLMYDCWAFLEANRVPSAKRLNVLLIYYSSSWDNLLKHPDIQILNEQMHKTRWRIETLYCFTGTGFLAWRFCCNLPW